MKQTILQLLLSAFLFTLNCIAAEPKEPLPDYVAQFNEADAKIRAIDSSTHCKDYCQWVEQAIDAKVKLNLEREICPWIDQLEASHSNSWRTLHAAAHGLNYYHHSAYPEYSIQKTIGFMDRAYQLIQTETPTPADKLYFYNAYIMDLMCYADPYLLQQKRSPGQTLRAVLRLAEDPYFTPKKRAVFYDLPTSYESADNDGEIIRWLIHEKASIPAKDPGITFPDFAVWIAGSQVNSPRKFDNSSYDDSVIKILSSLKDEETVFWGRKTNEYYITELPEEYRFIRDYEQRAENGDAVAAMALGQIFVNRCQFERAAQWYEKAGCTNEVLSIRRNQGVILPHEPYIAGLPVAINYSYRNGSEVELEIYPINAGSNLLSRLIARQVNLSEMKLLEGNSNLFMELYGSDYAGLLGQQLHHWTLPLVPASDHHITRTSINVPELPPGNYLMRATMKDGNPSEMILHISDTALYQFYYDDPEAGDKDHKRDALYLLCDALTGEPRPDLDIHMCKLSGDKPKANDEKKDILQTLNEYLLKHTDPNGMFTFPWEHPDDGSDWNAIEVSRHPAPFISADINVTTVTPFDLGDYFSDTWDSRHADFITTDRPIYRPDETGHLKRWYKHRKENYLPPPPTLKSGYKSYSLPLKTNPALVDDGVDHLDDFGGIDYTFTIPQNAPLGRYCISFPNNPYGYQPAVFCIEEYRTPEIQFDAKLAGNDKILISANYTYGKPLPSGTVIGLLHFEESQETQWFYPHAPFDAAWGEGYWWHGAQIQQKNTTTSVHGMSNTSPSPTP